MINAQASQPFTATVDEVPADRAALLGVRILTAAGALVTPRTTTAEPVVTGGDVYRAQLTAPALPGDYLVAWDTGGDALLDVATEELRVVAGAAPLPTPGGLGVEDIDAVAARAVSLDRTVAARPAVARLLLEDLEGYEPPAGDVDADVLDPRGLLIASATAQAGDAELSFTLDADVIPAPTRLTVVWSAGEWAAVTIVEVAGAVLFTVADARRAGIPEERATDLEVGRARTDAERELEDACRVAFARRYARERISVDEFGRARLAHWRDPVLRDVMIDGEPADAARLSDLRVGPTGLLADRQDRLSDGTEFVVGYEHGYGHPPARASIAARVLTRARLMKGPVDDRATAIPVEGGGSIPLLTPGLRGSIFGIAEVDQFVRDFRERRPTL